MGKRLFFVFLLLCVARSCWTGHPGIEGPRMASDFIVEITRGQAEAIEGFIQSFLVLHPFWKNNSDTVFRVDLISHPTAIFQFLTILGFGRDEILPKLTWRYFRWPHEDLKSIVCKV